MTLHVFTDTLMSPGDILHEAGHVAVVPSLFRDKIKGDAEASIRSHIDDYMNTHAFHSDDGLFTENEIMRGCLQCGEGEAMAWSYAAAFAAGIPPESVFHDNSYDGEGKSLIEMFSMGAHFGVHGLQAAKMTTVRTFPQMMRWFQV